MDNPGAWHLKQMVQKINEIGQRGSGASVDDYLRALASDPTTEWFTELLREKTAELAKERQQADLLACALRAWYQTKQATPREPSADEAELQLVNLLHEMGILKP